MDVKISFPRSSETYADQMSGQTAHPAVNAVPYVCQAAPGIVSNTELPVIAPFIG
jgi:4-hydroxy-tetrahydrodipicolinate reductase